MDDVRPIEGERRALFRPLVWLAWLATGTLILLALGLVLENWLAERAWQRYLARLKAAGEPMTAAEVLRKPPADGDNFAMIPLLRPLRDYHREPPGRDQFAGAIVWHEQAGMEKLTKLQPFPGVAMKPLGVWVEGKLSEVAAMEQALRKERKQGEPPLPEGPPGTALRAHLAQFEPMMEQLREGAKRPRAQFAPDYDAGILTQANYASPLLSIAKILSARSYASLALGLPQPAADDVTLHLRLANLLRDEPMVLPAVVRGAIVGLAIGPIWEGLARRQWDDAQLSAIEHELAGCDFVSAMKYAVVSEKILGTWPLYEQLIRSPGSMADLAPMSKQTALPLVKMSPAGVFVFNRLRSSEAMDRTAKMADVQRHRIDLAAANAQAEEASASAASSSVLRYNPHNLLAWFFKLAVNDLPFHMARIQARVDLARCAVALERYRLKHHEYPPALVALAPDFLVVPNDALSGEPPNYGRESDGTFTLYLTGGSMRGDGNAPLGKRAGPKVDATKDWVWPRPAFATP